MTHFLRDILRQPNSYGGSPEFIAIPFVVVSSSLRTSTVYCAKTLKSPRIRITITHSDSREQYGIMFGRRNRDWRR